MSYIWLPARKSQARHGRRPTRLPKRQKSTNLSEVPEASQRSKNQEPDLKRNTSLEERSLTPSPHALPTSCSQFYGNANLTDRSRSPSPVACSLDGRKPFGKVVQSHHSKARQRPLPLELNLMNSGHNRRYPRLHRMPKVLPSPTFQDGRTSPASSVINFPKLSSSPSRSAADDDDEEEDLWQEAEDSFDCNHFYHNI